MPKRIVPLSDIQVKNAKPREKEFKLMDGYGLFLLITPTNGKLWRFDYRIGDKRKTIAFGSYPAVTLADARQRRDDAKKLLANGVDPGEMKKSLKLKEQVQKEIDANTFEKIAREWHEHKKPEWSDNHAERLLHRLELDVFPTIGNRPIVEVERSELVNELRRVSV